MTIALIDNGSLEPAAHRNLRTLAGALSARTGNEVHAVSWKHSDKIRPDQLDGKTAWTLAPWLRAQVARGERDFVFVPFFISAQGAIGSWLQRDFERLRNEHGGFRYNVTSGLAAQGALVKIITSWIRETIAALRLSRPAAVIVDHGGPSAASAILRNQVAAEVARELGPEIAALTPASLEGGEYEHTQPLLADALTLPGFDRGDVVIAPLFLAPGRHAGPKGDLEQIAEAAEDRGATTADSFAPLHCHFTPLVGTHPDVVDVLAEALNHTLSTLHAAA